MTKPVIGLTGPTGAGKSTVAAAFRKASCVIVDADRIARQTADLPECLARLKETFGAEILRPDGTLNREELARRAFSSPEGTAKLNAVMHPAILEESKKQIASAKPTGCRAVILDAPLLFESGAQTLCGATVAVVAPPKSRLKRIMARDGISEEQARVRMKAQHGEDYYASRADYVFNGSTDWSVLDQKVGELLDRILRELE